MSYDIILIGTSQGGLPALESVFRGVPVDDLPPVVLILHRPAGSGPALKQLLDRRLPFTSIEPDDKDPIQPHHFYLAPAGYHLLVERDEFHLSVDEQVCHARPSIDVLFESAAFAYGKGSLGVILSGAGSDGALGAAQIADHGGTMLVQSPATAESPSMPEAALGKLRERARVLPLNEIGDFIGRCHFTGGAHE